MNARKPSRDGTPSHALDGAVGVIDGIDDPVLAALATADERYRAVRAVWLQESAALQQTREELAEVRERERAARDEVRALKTQADVERAKAERNRARADRLAAALKDVHRALFSGNVYDHILRACLSLTGATRGVYLSIESGDRFRARAAVEVPGYPRKEPSPFLRGVCGRVLDAKSSVLSNAPTAETGVPPPARDEGFANVLAAPVAILRHFHGVVVLGDKAGGFDSEDADTVMSIGDQAGVAIENRQLQEELLRAYFSVVGVLADAIEAKDAYTHGHCELVAHYSRLTAARLEASDEVRGVTCYGGLLHDIGKIGVSDGVLNKPGKLSPEEWTLMQSHVRIGRDLLAHVPPLGGVSDVVLHHHERFDGGGYPDGLRGDAIPLAARIVGVVDAYCAMTSKRSYKESVSPAEARAELVRCQGTQFDPTVVDAFLAVLDDPASVPPTDMKGAVVADPHDGGEFLYAIRRDRP